MRKYSAYLLLALFGLLVLIPNAPSHQEEIRRDSGVFLYMGEQVLEGKIPYRDLWDHKGPVIYYIDAISLLVGGGSRWGIWVFELLSLTAASLLSYTTLHAALGPVPATFGTLTWLVGLSFVHNGGNLSEEYSLPWQFAAILLFWRSRKTDQYSYLHCFLIGLTASVSFFLRPNNIGVQLTIVILITIYAIFTSEWKKWIFQGFAILAGMLLIASGIGLYFLLNNAISEFYTAFFLFNFTYSATPWLSRWDAVREGYTKYLSPTRVQFIVLPTWIVALIYSLQKRDNLSPRTSLLHLAIIGLPLEAILSGISGESYEHYYMMWLPVIGILAGYFAYGVLTRFSSTSRKPLLTSRNLTIYIALEGILALPSWKIFPAMLPYPNPKYPQITRQILNFLDGEEFLIMWGAEATREDNRLHDGGRGEGGNKC